MNWSACAALVALVVASVSFGASEARNWRCRSPEFPIAKSVPVCLYETKAGEYEIKQLVHGVQYLLFEDPAYLYYQGIIQDIVNQIADVPTQVVWPKVNETITRILRVWCSDVDKLGGASEVNEFDDNVTPICHTLIYTVEFKFGTLELGVKLLIRGSWGGKGAPQDEINNRDCYSMCKLFRDGSTVNIAGLRARPAYLGCWLKEAGNGEEIKPNMFGNTLDCEGFNPNKPNNNNGGGGGGGSAVGWILVGLVGLAIVVIALGAVAFWFFKIRTPPAPSTASGLAESFAPSINLSKA